MAKIFSTEKLALNGDKVRIESSESGAFEITDGSSVLISRATIGSDVSSLNTQDSDNKTAVADDIDSLSTLHAGNVTVLDSDVLSLNTQDSDNKTAVADDIDSLALLVSTNDVYAVQEDVSENSISVTIDYSSVGFASAPAVVGSLTSYVADDPIIGVQLSGDPSTSSAVFMFSDEIPSTGYKIDVLASV